MCFVFFFNDTATTEIYTLSLHDALPIFSLYDSPSPTRSVNTSRCVGDRRPTARRSRSRDSPATTASSGSSRSEEHTSELQSRQYLVCRLLLEKKKNVLSIEIHDIAIHIL